MGAARNPIGSQGQKETDGTPVNFLARTPKRRLAAQPRTAGSGFGFNFWRRRNSGPSRSRFELDDEPRLRAFGNFELGGRGGDEPGTGLLEPVI